MAVRSDPKDLASTASARLASVSPIDDGAVLERLVRMRNACQALALDLAASRRELRAVQAELRRLKSAESVADRS